MNASRPQRAASPGVAELPRDHARAALARLAEQACRIAGLDRACIFLRDQLSEVSMTVAAVHGLPGGMVGQSFGIVDGLAGRVLITGRPVLVDGQGSVPISWSGQVRGALSAGSVDRELGQHDVD